MPLKKKPVNGMKDILPREMEIRSYVMDKIRETYGSFGFCQVETPALEHISNLCSKQGGENEKLIFKVLKRGEKLKIDQAKEEGDLVDFGLRYDLTLPLSRYYSNNANDLPSPFKALQMGPVWRADRPQRGRYRQFVQCDIDILGEASNLAEISLVQATTTLLGKLEFKNFTIRINDRSLLKSMAKYAGFEDKDLDTVFIILDKMDKIGLDGVREELLETYSQEIVDKYLDLFVSENEGTKRLEELKTKLEGFVDPKTCDNLAEIIETSMIIKTSDFNIAFDPTLVRGMGYYTGPIFEIAMDEFGGSVGGGGRYDEMIGKFTGNNTPACGFSIGFERIVLLLLERGYEIPREKEKIAYLVEKNMPSKYMIDIHKKAMDLRSQGYDVSVDIMKKNKKFQKEQMEKDGYGTFVEFFKDKMEENN